MVTNLNISYPLEKELQIYKMINYLFNNIFQQRTLEMNKFLSNKNFFWEERNTIHRLLSLNLPANFHPRKQNRVCRDSR